MATQAFVHLRTRSAYSQLESTLHVKDLAKLCLAHDMPALALTDRDNLFGALEFSEVFAEKGLQPIIGCVLKVRHEAGLAGLTLLAKDEIGYANLMQLSSKAYLDAPPQDAPHIPWAVLEAHREGLIALSGGYGGLLDSLIREDRLGLAQDMAGRLAALFPSRFYIELQRVNRMDEARIEGALLDLAYDLGLPLVASNDVCFRDRAQHRAHDVLTCIAGGTYLGAEDRERTPEEMYFKSGAEMRALFADLPEALDNTQAIAQRISFRPVSRAPILPRFTSDAGRDEPAELAAQARDGLTRRLLALGDRAAAEESVYWQRLEFELSVIEEMRFPGYFLIVADFIKWAKLQGIPVGPGRGSGAGSLVAYALTITDLDPLRFGLLFERFLNPERVSMPDFDIDFCQDRRGEVIEYVKQRYGADRVAQIITFGTLQARVVLRDVGRVMQMHYGQVDRLAKLVPANPANPVTLAQAIDMEPLLQEARAQEADVRELLDVALQLEGLNRNASTHAAGLVISDRPLVELTPLYRDARSDLPATQFNMKWVEPAGLVKFDFLGLKTLTVLDRAKKYLAKRGITLDLDAIPFDDPATFALLASGATYGVFQLESQGMRDTLRKVRPDALEDIIALISLYRPGPMKNIDTYADAKFGRRKPDYLHALIKPVLTETHGVIIYQEQVMQIAQLLSGYSLGEADLLRRAMGKKKPEEMAKQKSRFLAGAKERQVDESLAERIFDLVAEFAGYGFNKSHAAAYAVLAFQTAYLKANYPVEFLAASMSLDAHQTDKLAAFHQEARRLGVEVRAPGINSSMADFDVCDGAIVYALGAVRNVGAGAMDMLVRERQRGGPFKHLFDFAERLDPKAINRRQLENLAKAGAFDELEPNRARAFAACEILAALAARTAQERASAQASLFGDEEPAARPALPDVPAWSSLERHDHERDSVGFYLSGHPLSGFFANSPSGRYLTIVELSALGEGETRICAMAGVLRRIIMRPSNSGGQFAYVTFSDPTGEFEAMIMPEQLAGARAQLEVGKALSFTSRVRWKEGDMRLSVSAFEPIEAVEARSAQHLTLVVSEGAPLKELAKTLEALRASSPADEARGLHLILRLRDGREIGLIPKGSFPAGAQARAALKAVRGVEQVM